MTESFPVTRDAVGGGGRFTLIICSLYVYVGPAVSGRRNRSGEGETAENIWCSSFLPFPLSATILFGWK